MFVLGNPYQSGLKSLRAKPEPTQLDHLSDASFLGKLLVSPTNVRLDWKVIASYEHSSLFGLVVSNEGKKIDNIDTWYVNLIKRYLFVADVLGKKLECLS